MLCAVACCGTLWACVWTKLDDIEQQMNDALILFVCVEGPHVEARKESVFANSCRIAFCATSSRSRAACFCNSFLTSILHLFLPHCMQSADL